MDKKREFLLGKYLERLREIEADMLPLWGLMNPIQMVEHMTHSFQLANGKIKVEKILTPQEDLVRVQTWLVSNKPMKQNLNNPLLPKNPPVPRNQTMEMAVLELQREIVYLCDFYSRHRETKLLNPFFGELGEEHQIQLLYKHALHNLAQFGIKEDYIED